MLYLKFRRLFVGVLRGYDKAPTDKQLKKLKENPGLEDPGFFATRDKYPKVAETKDEELEIKVEELKRKNLEDEIRVERLVKKLHEKEKKELQAKIDEMERKAELEDKLRELRRLEKADQDLEKGR